VLQIFFFEGWWERAVAFVLLLVEKIFLFTLHLF
jgi:hypothetical protein